MAKFTDKDKAGLFKCNGLGYSYFLHWVGDMLKPRPKSCNYCGESTLFWDEDLSLYSTEECWVCSDECRAKLRWINGFPISRKMTHLEYLNFKNPSVRWYPMPRTFSEAFFGDKNEKS